MIPIPQDPGLQRERTAMAWNRTGLAVLVNALLVLRAGAVSSQMAILAAGALLLTAAGGFIAFGTWRSHHLTTPAGATTPWLLIAATVATAWIACAAGVASVLVSRPHG